TNPIILRYADVLLVLAEAENDVSGPTGAAYAAIDEVRNRSNVPNLTPGLSQAQFRDSVWLERRHELYGEFQEWFDLKRQGRWLDIMNDRIPAYPGGATRTSCCSRSPTRRSARTGSSPRTPATKSDSPGRCEPAVPRSRRFSWWPPVAPTRPARRSRRALRQHPRCTCRGTRSPTRPDARYVGGASCGTAPNTPVRRGGAVSPAPPIRP